MKRATVILIKVQSSRALLRMLLERIRSYVMPVLRYNVIILVTYYLNTVFTWARIWQFVVSLGNTAESVITLQWIRAIVLEQEKGDRLVQTVCLQDYPKYYKCCTLWNHEFRIRILNKKHVAFLHDSVMHTTLLKLCDWLTSCLSGPWCNRYFSGPCNFVENVQETFQVLFSPMTHKKVTYWNTIRHSQTTF